MDKHNLVRLEQDLLKRGSLDLEDADTLALLRVKQNLEARGHLIRSCGYKDDPHKPYALYLEDRGLFDG